MAIGIEGDDLEDTGGDPGRQQHRGDRTGTRRAMTRFAAELEEERGDRVEAGVHKLLGRISQRGVGGDPLGDELSGLHAFLPVGVRPVIVPQWFKPRVDGVAAYFPPERPEVEIGVRSL